MRLSRVAVALVAFAAIFVLSPPAAHAQDADPVFREAPRNVTFTVADTRVDVVSTSLDPETPDMLTWSFEVDDTDNEVAMRVRYKKHVDDAEDTHKMQIRLVNIVEFVDATGNGYDPADTVVSSFDIGGTARGGWDQISDDSVQGAPLYQAETQTGDNRVRFNVYAADNVTTVGIPAVTVRPTDLKWTLSVFNFPYQQAGTSLAIQIRIDSRGNRTIGDDAALQAVMAGGAFLSFSNVSTNTQGIVEMMLPALETVIINEPGRDDDETTSRGFFSFVAGQSNTIIWDPYLSVVNPGEDEGSSAASTLAPSFRLGSLAVGLLLLVATSWL